MTFAEILKGDVTFKSNLELCFIDTIQWDDIVHESYTNVSIQTSNDCKLNGLPMTCFIENSISENFCS